MATSLVDSLRPVARDQFKPTDVILRATSSNAEYTARGTYILLTWDMSGFASFCIQLLGDSHVFAIEGSNDLINWTALDYRILGEYEAPEATYGFTQDNNLSTIVAANKQTRFARIRENTGTVTVRPAGILVALSQTPFVPVKPLRHYGPSQAWNYVAASGGIINTTPVTVRAATNSSHRTLVTAMQLDNSGATGTEVILTETGGSTILWRGWLPSGGTRHITFDPPLRTPVLAALNLTLTAASGAAVYANIQGITGLG
jgi:hypothetical protein